MGLANALTITDEQALQMAKDLDLDDWNPADFHDFENFDFGNNVTDLLTDFYSGAQPHSLPGANSLRNPKFQMMRRGGAGAADGRAASPQDKEFIQRFLQLKYSIIFLQRTKKFGRYCFYGCWCLPNGASDLGVGTGPPIDNIDRSCREFATCYNCLYNREIGRDCEESNTGRYVIKGRQDKVTGRKYLMCMDTPGSCKRMRCECDRSLAEKLQTYEGEWSLQNHRRWGQPPFSAEQYCKVAVPQPIAPSVPQEDTSKSFTQESRNEMSVDESEESNKGGYGGDKGDDSFPNTREDKPVTTTNQSKNPVVASAPIYGEIVGCCGRSPDLHYFRRGQRCCTDGEIVDASAPCGIDFL